MGHRSDALHLPRCHADAGSAKLLVSFLVTFETTTRQYCTHSTYPNRAQTSGESEVGLQKYVNGRKVLNRDWIASHEVSFWRLVGGVENKRDCWLSSFQESNRERSTASSSSSSAGAAASAAMAVVAAVSTDVMLRIGH